MLGGLFRVGSSEKPPSNAAVTARHRGRWFYIADNDQTSKSTLSLLNSLYALQAGDVQETKPILTIPIGGN